MHDVADQHRAPLASRRHGQPHSPPHHLLLPDALHVAVTRSVCEDATSEPVDDALDGNDALVLFVDAAVTVLEAANGIAPIAAATRAMQRFAKAPPPDLLDYFVGTGEEQQRH